MDNVIAQCFVIESKDYGVEPVIYLRRPMTHENNEKLHLFFTPFEAKAFIRNSLPSVEVTVTKEVTTQLAMIWG